MPVPRDRPAFAVIGPFFSHRYVSIISTPKATDITGDMTTALDNPYLRDAVMTATPEQLQLMLYDGAIRFCHQARDAILDKDYETSYEKLTRAQNIILEMQGGLRFDVNRPLCERVSAIYGFLYRKLVDANVHRSTEEIDDALKVLRVERETWQILVDKVNQVQEGADSGCGEDAEAKDGSTATFSAEG